MSISCMTQGSIYAIQLHELTFALYHIKTIAFNRAVDSEHKADLQALHRQNDTWDHYITAVRR